MDPTLRRWPRRPPAWGADLLVVHHPLFLKPVHGFAATTPKGRTLATLARAGCALLTAHTNADQADGGVSEALATALGLTDLSPIVPLPDEPMDKLVVYVPEDAAAPLRAAIVEAGAGAIGNYDHCTFTSPGQGRFRPLQGADPTIGTIGTVEVVDEHRIECVLPRRARSAVVAALKAAHPYETPAFDVIEMADPGTSALAPAGSAPSTATTLEEFADRGRRRPARDRARRPGRRRRRRAPYAGSRCAGEPATSCSTGWPARTSTSTSPATCGTTRRPSSPRRAARPWSTSRTGRPSGPGCRWSRRA